MLDFVDEALDQMTFAVQPSIVLAHYLRPLVRWDHRLNASLHEVIDEVGSRIASVGNQALKIEAFQQVLSLGDVVALAGGQGKSQWIAQTINCHMNFGAKATSTATQRLFTVFFQPLPRRDVLAQSCCRSCRFPDQGHR